MLRKSEFIFRSSDIRLISNFRGIPKDGIDVQRNTPVELKSLLDKALNRLVYDKQRVDFLQFLSKHWTNWFAGTTAAHCKPERLTSKGCLWIKVPNSIIQQKIQFELNAIKNTLNQILTTYTIKEIKCRL